MKLIPLDALVAEIDKLQLCTMDEHLNFYSAEAQGEYNALSKLESFLDTLEVKEVDLEKEIEEHVIYMPMSEFTHESEVEDFHEWAREEFRHFFELGLSVSNSIKVTTPDIDDVLKENGVNPYSKEAKVFKESYYMALEKLKAQKG